MFGGTGPVIRVAAVGDLHVRATAAGSARFDFARLAGHADVLLLAGDLTNGGTLAEAELLCREVAEAIGAAVPVVAVLGNHDHDEGHGERITVMLRAAGAHVLDGDGVVLDLDGSRLGIAGVVGGGGGFPETPHGSGGTHPQLDDRLRQGPIDAGRLRAALRGLDCADKIALMHFAPVADTLAGEPLEIYPSLGCHLLAHAVDDGGARLAVHGHAHHGSERGTTPGGTPVRNVARPVLRRPYAIYDMSMHHVA